MGQELELFREAGNWKRYWTGQIASFLTGHVLEVGAGLGANMPYLVRYEEQFQSLTMLEPDPVLADLAARTVYQPTVPVRAICGDVYCLPEGATYDTLLYIDVLEHIADDGHEVKRALSLLRPGGCLIILVPAFPFLYSPFDKSIGHFRRYTKASLNRLIPSTINNVALRYLDSMGFIASLSNRIFLKQEIPTSAQVAFWDRRLVPLSGITDKAFGSVFGKSLLGVWKK